MEQHTHCEACGAMILFQLRHDRDNPTSRLCPDDQEKQVEKTNPLASGKAAVSA